MNDNDEFKKVPEASALTALPPNGARVNATRVGRRGAPSNSRSSGTARVARLRPGDVVETLRVSPPSGGAAQLAPR